MNVAAIYRPICWVRGHDWVSGQMYSDGWTDTCSRCGQTESRTH